MPSPARVAAAHARRQAALTRQAAQAAAAVWRAVALADLDASWQVVAARAVALLAAGQYAAADQAAAYVQAQAEAQSLDISPSGTVNAAAFAGTAADGRPLASLLRQGIIDTKAAIAAGMSGRDAMRRGQASLTLAFVNETAQAGRNADHVAITTTPQLTGYVRLLSGVSCSRCTILAGRFYRWNKGFQRHPHCDCIHVPAAEPRDVADIDISPRARFDSLTREEQDRIFTKAGAQAIRDGADMSQVVNVNRGMEAFGVTRTRVNADGRVVNVARRRFIGNSTREGANVVRGRYGRAAADASGQSDLRQRAANGRYGPADMFELADVARLTPRAIYHLAGDDRALAVELLARYGYIT